MLINAGEIINKSWGYYAKNFKKLVPMMCLLFIPNFVLGLVGIFSLYMDQYAATGVYMLINNLVVLAVFVGSLVFTLWASMALAKNLGLIVHEKPLAALKEAFSDTSHLIWPAIYTAVLVCLAVLGGTLLLIIPGIIFSIWFCFSYLAVIFDEKRGVAALTESKKMVSGRWWKILWRMLAPGIFYGVLFVIIYNLLNYTLGSIFQIEPNIIYTSEDSNYIAYQITGGFFYGILSSLLSPLTALTSILLYFSAKENPVQVNPVIEADKK
ncbi:MAG: hypothetical protein WC457_04395 [Patescibacteria group bacterium]